MQVHNKRPEKHIKMGCHMLYKEYLIILNGQSIKKISFGKFYF